MANPRPSTTNRTGVQDPLLKYNIQRKSKAGCLRKCIIIVFSILIIVLLLGFIIVFVAIPLIFKYSPDIQRSFIFPISQIYPKNPEFTNFAKYNISGVRNFYVPVDKAKNISLGVWHILPEALIENSTQDNDFNYTYSLEKTEYPVVLYFHGNGGNRIDYIGLYLVLRAMFHIIAFDYRCYGDSSKGKLTEDAIVQDSVELYKWLRSNTDGDIYIWGHSIGCALGALTIAKLRNENLTPTGLFLEAPFSTMKDEVKFVLTKIPYTKIFSWLPWYETTLIDSFEANGFRFKTTEYIIMVDCPIMIVHAKDDTIVPYTHSEQLYKIAAEKRNLTVQGNVTLHMFPAHLEYDHFYIYSDSRLPSYIRNHIEICEAFKEKTKIMDI